MSTAFEAITTRQAWYASEAMDKYYAAEIGADGKYALATGVGQFAGIVQYGAEAADRMVTVVKGTFPAIGSEAIDAGEKVTLDALNPGQFVVAAAGDAQDDLGDQEGSAARAGRRLADRSAAEHPRHHDAAGRERQHLRRRHLHRPG